MICPHCGSKVEFDRALRGWQCEECHRVFTAKKKKKPKNVAQFDLHSAYVESLEDEIKELKRDVLDMHKCKTFVRCPNCERLHDGLDVCPHCGNNVRDYQIKRRKWTWFERGKGWNRLTKEC